MSLRADHRVYVAARRRGATPVQAARAVRQARIMRRMVVSLNRAIEDFARSLVPAVNRTARAMRELQKAFAKAAPK